MWAVYFINFILLQNPAIRISLHVILAYMLNKIKRDYMILPGKLILH